MSLTPYKTAWSSVFTATCQSWSNPS